MIPLNNCCDGIYRSFDIHFTSVCDNHCSYCIDKRTTYHPDNKRPDWKKMADTVLCNKNEINDILILGGEPFLYQDELLSFVSRIKQNSNLGVYITTSFPKTIYDDKCQTFLEILNIVDGINISAHHFIQSKADKVRGTRSEFKRNEVYKFLPHKEKIRICLNLVKGSLDDKKEIKRAVKFFDDFGSIKLNELQHATESFVSFENIMGIKFPSPYYHGCQTNINNLFPDSKSEIILKRSCFMVEPSLKAGLKDGLKLLYKKFFLSSMPERVFGVVFEDGKLQPRWRI